MRTPKPLEKIYIKNNPLFSRESGCKPCKIESVILGTIFVRPFKAHELIETLPEDIDYIEDERMSSQEKQKLVIDYVKPEFIKDFKDRMREIGAINKLEKMYPSYGFWSNFHINFRVRSFNYFVGSGREQIAIMYKKFCLDNNLIKEQTCVKLSASKLGEDVQTKKQLNLFE
jgi:hypothetical protein